MGVSSSNQIKRNHEAKKSIEDKGNKKTEEVSKSKNLFDCFKEEEIKLINKEKMKMEDEIKKGKEEEKYIIKPLYHKVQINLLNKEKTFTTYIVLYLPKNYDQHQTINYAYSLNCNKSRFNFEENYILVNNNPKTTKSLCCNKHSEGLFFAFNELEIIPPVIKSNIEFIITQNDIEKNLIIIESSYNLEFEAYYGYYALYLLDNSIPISLSLIVNDDFVIINDLKKFHKISKSELFSIFEEKRPEIDLKNTKIKNDIRNEIDKKLLSSFSDKEIEQINLSFNQMEFDDTAHLIYHKVIHNIKNNKDYIKYYGIVFRPYIYFNRGAAGTDYYGGVEPIIVKKFKINDKLVKNEEEEGEDCSENDYGGTGSFLSNNKRLELKHHYQDNFSVLEIDCESNENVDYFKLNFT